MPAPSQLATLAAIGRFLSDSTRGYRLRPWDSPYLRWRIETYWGWPAPQIGARRFFRFLWLQRRQLLHFLVWAGRMSAQHRPRAN